MTKLARGGLAVNLAAETAVAAMCAVQDWSARNKFRNHIPKNLLNGTARLMIRNFYFGTTAMDIVKMIQAQGVEVVDLYMLRNDYGTFRGSVKITVRGNDTVQYILDQRRILLKGVYRPVEPQTKMKNCNNCGKFHLAKDCKVGKQCRKCGSEEHLAKDCPITKDELSQMCSYCHSTDHSTTTCEVRKEDEKRREWNIGKITETPLNSRERGINTRQA